MAERLVVDASVALGILLREPGAAQARARLLAAPEADLLVPAHFWLEVANVLLRRYGRAPDQVVAALRELDELGLETVETDRPALLLALDLGARHSLTSYDAAYLALTELEDAGLLTLDERLAAGAGSRAIGNPPRGIAEARPRYSPVDAPHWAAHGRYLAELRRAAAG